MGMTTSQREWAEDQIGASITVFPTGENVRWFDMGNRRAVFLARGADGPVIWMATAPLPTEREHARMGAIESVHTDPDDPTQRQYLIDVEAERVAGERAALCAAVADMVEEFYAWTEPEELPGMADLSNEEPPITDDPEGWNPETATWLPGYGPDAAPVG